jgi:uncharacterized membrane protein
VARIYANENIPLLVVRELRDLEHDVLTTAEAGNAGQATPDEAVLTFACAQDRAVLTLNRRHFVRLHQITPGHRGIIVCSFDRDPVALAQRVHAAIAESTLLAGQLIRVNRPADAVPQTTTRI